MAHLTKTHALIGMTWALGHNGLYFIQSKLSTLTLSAPFHFFLAISDKIKFIMLLLYSAFLCPHDTLADMTLIYDSFVVQ